MNQAYFSYACFCASFSLNMVLLDHTTALFFTVGTSQLLSTVPANSCSHHQWGGVLLSLRPCQHLLCVVLFPSWLLFWARQGSTAIAHVIRYSWPSPVLSSRSQLCGGSKACSKPLPKLTSISTNPHTLRVPRSTLRSSATGFHISRLTEGKYMPGMAYRTRDEAMRNASGRWLRECRPKRQEWTCTRMCWPARRHKGCFKESPFHLQHVQPTFLAVWAQSELFWMVGFF